MVYPYMQNFSSKFELLTDIFGDSRFVDFLLDAFSLTYKYKDNFIPLVDNLFGLKFQRKYQ